MKRVAALLGILALPANPAWADSIASKVEELGKMKYLNVSSLKTVNRNGLLNIQAEITNDSASNQQLFYRFKWFDGNGFEVGGEEPWKPLTIYGKQRQNITTVAPMPQATDFRLVLQSPDNETTSPSSW
ncbi:MAG: YcfL family protein [Betaproteobacteria bacterium]|nr:YcfL family protein [Betaproteobacteria bacterium]